MGQHRVLVIDDSDDVHELVGMWLAEEGIELVCAGDGPAGLEMARRATLDLVLLDVDMPGMDGFEVCRRLKADPITRELPVVFLSGAVEPEKKLLGLEMGAVDYVGKPFDPAELRARVRGAIRTRQLMAQLAESERFARSTVDALSTHIAILDGRGVIIAANRAWLDFARASLPDPAWVSRGSNYLESCDTLRGWLGGRGPEVAAGIRSVLSGAAPEFATECPWHSEAERRWFGINVSRFPDGGPVRVVVARDNISKQKAAEERLRHASLHDALTGLPNRVLFTDQVEHCMRRAERDPGTRFAVLFLDLDRFKVINDSLGHAAADHLLVTVAERLRRCVREADAVARFSEESAVARLGGDEFTILLEDLGSSDDAARVAERIQAEVAQPMMFAGHEISTTASIGIVAGTTDYASATALLRDADVAMYRAKALGKARYAIFDSALHDAAVARLRLENDLRRALHAGEFELHYQPLVTLGTGQTVGFEALIRWRRAGALVSPAEFIPIAEETGLIVPIGSWVIREAVEQLARWRAAAAAAAVDPAARALCVSVNLSRRQFSDATLVAHVEDCLRRNDIPPSLLKLEITESMIMEDRGVATDVLDRLKALGVSICIDDFGIGHSSLSCLHEFPIDFLKIDRSFITGAQTDRGRTHVLRAILALARNLGLRAIAEGVETPDQRAFLLSHGCDLGQGYLFSPAVPADKAIETVTPRCQIPA